MISPKTIKLRRAENLLDIQFDDGTLASLPAEYLRVESPSAEVQGHGTELRRVPGGKQHVGITGIEPAGNYAIKLVFSDGHDTGIFTWDYLYFLNTEYDRRWADYLRALKQAGLGRDPSLPRLLPGADSRQSTNRGSDSLIADQTLKRG